MVILDTHAAAGTIAGLFAAIALHPLDTVKVRFQVQDGVVHAARFTSVRGAVADIWAREGARGFYRGVVPACVGAGASWGLYFYFYEAAKRRVAGADRPTSLQTAYAAWEGGTLTSLLTNPIWLVKTRMQLEGGGGGGGAGGAVATGASSATGVTGLATVGTKLAPYASLRGALASILREEGVRGLYRGLVPALLLTSHGVVQFTAYEYLKAELPAARGEDDSARLFAFGLASKAAASLATYPYQVVKSRVQQRFEGEREYRGLLDALRKIAAREGLRGFYKGFVANVLRVMPQSALTLLAYERVRAALDAAVARPGEEK